VVCGFALYDRRAGPDLILAGRSTLPRSEASWGGH